VSCERDRLQDSRWRLWGPYLAEREWGTPRENDGSDEDPWKAFPFDEAHVRAYRSGEDGLLGFCDERARLCLALALWNGNDDRIKERLFGLAQHEGNHGEDVKELYWFEDGLPSHAYQRARYAYPHAAFPYFALRESNAARTREEPELELVDTGILDEDRVFDVVVEYAKGSPTDVLARYAVTNRGPEPATVHVVPQLWFRNTWRQGGARPRLTAQPSSGDSLRIEAEHPELPGYRLYAPALDELVVTDNDDGAKDALHHALIHGAPPPTRTEGTKVCLVYRCTLQPGERVVLRLRLSDQPMQDPLGAGFDTLFAERLREADAFHTELGQALDSEARTAHRAALAGLLWTKQAYVLDAARMASAKNDGPNAGWDHLRANHVLTMPDTWEFPWLAAWDMAFHCVPFAMLDPAFAKSQLTLLTREYQHPNGQIPGHETDLRDLHPPVLAWATWRVCGIEKQLHGRADLAFLERTFLKLFASYVWWLARQDHAERYVFSGGRLGLDNASAFDRSEPPPTGGTLEQVDATAWMATFALHLLQMAVELGKQGRPYEELAVKLFVDFLGMADAVAGFYDGPDGFFYDRIRLPDGTARSVRIRSCIGLVPLFAVATLKASELEALPAFTSRVRTIVRERGEDARGARFDEVGRLQLSAVDELELRRLTAAVLDETELLSPYGVRSLSRWHRDNPYELEAGDGRHRIEYEPAEGKSDMLGGNSNWRGPVWLPFNWLLVEALHLHGRQYGSRLVVELPTGGAAKVALGGAASELSHRVGALFRRGPDGVRPASGPHSLLRTGSWLAEPHLFHEYYHGETGQGLGASHQTGWSALAATLLRGDLALASIAADPD